MFLFVDTPNGTRFTLTADKGETILEIKSKIEDYCGCPPSQLQLFYNDVLLVDNVTLQECNFPESITAVIRCEYLKAQSGKK